jgi:hypothetical protein
LSTVGEGGGYKINRQTGKNPGIGGGGVSYDNTSYAEVEYLPCKLII